MGARPTNEFLEGPVARELRGASALTRKRISQSTDVPYKVQKSLLQPDTFVEKASGARRRRIILEHRSWCYEKDEVSVRKFFKERHR